MPMGTALHFESLPPPYVRLIDPRHDKIPTPVDERGLIDIPRLISDVKATVDPDYIWPNRPSVHHFHWPEALYPYAEGPDVSVNPAQFRNLPIHKGLVVRTFENWLHLITLPSQPPELEVQAFRVEGYQVAKNLFATARETVQWEKRARRRRELVSANPDILRQDFNGQDIIGEAIMHEVLEKHFRSFEKQLEEQEKIPLEFRLVNLDGTPAEIAASLGSLVAKPSLELRRVTAA